MTKVGAIAKVFAITSMVYENCMLHVPQTWSFLGVHDNFWNQMFNKKLPKYKDRLDVIFPLCSPLEIINTNIISRHVFNHLQNYPITTNYIVDPKCVIGFVWSDPKCVSTLVLVDVEKSNWYKLCNEECFFRGSPSF